MVFGDWGLFVAATIEIVANDKYNRANTFKVKGMYALREYTYCLLSCRFACCSHLPSAPLPSEAFRSRSQLRTAVTVGSAARRRTTT